MYKKITHTIVEEHFAHPTMNGMSKEVKKTWKAPQRYYSDGEQISCNLPPSFCIATEDSRCGNCLAYDPATTICGKFSARVRPEYACAAWTVIPS
jgi:hypothetical protein